MEKEHIKVYISSMYWNESNGQWSAVISPYRPIISDGYYEVYIPIPDEILKNKLGTIETESPVKFN